MRTWANWLIKCTIIQIKTCGTYIWVFIATLVCTMVIKEVNCIYIYRWLLLGYLFILFTCIGYLVGNSLKKLLVLSLIKLWDSVLNIQTVKFLKFR